MTSKLMLTRKQLAAFLSDPDAIHAFERVFGACDKVEIGDSVSGTFTTVDGKTVTITDGIITAIV